MASEGPAAAPESGLGWNPVGPAPARGEYLLDAVAEHRSRGHLLRALDVCDTIAAQTGTARRVLAEARAARFCLLAELGRTAEADEELAHLDRATSPHTAAVEAASGLTLLGRDREALQWLDRACRRVLVRSADTLDDHDLLTHPEIVLRALVRRRAGLAPDAHDHTALSHAYRVYGVRDAEAPAALPGLRAFFANLQAPASQGPDLRTGPDGSLVFDEQGRPQLTFVVAEDVPAAIARGMVRGGDPAGYRRRIERRLVATGAPRALLWPISVADLDRLTETDLDPSDPRTLAGLLGHLSVEGAAPVPWPPASAAPCWCGSDSTYRVCCAAGS
ncbi:SEC-C domain-containing protein [Nocardiopsis coralliicola]